MGFILYNHTKHYFLERIRILHPIFAITWATFALVWTVGWMGRLPQFRRQWVALLVLIGCNILAGALNVFLLAPVWLQILHLLLADLIWVQFVWVILCAAINYTERENRGSSRA
jgi:heme A synthase